MKRYVGFILSLFALVPGVVFAAPASTSTHAGPMLKSTATEYLPSKNEFSSALVIDLASGKTLYEYRASEVWPAASLTKLMGALVFLDHQKVSNRLVTLTSADEVGGGRLRVASGARLSVRDMLYSSITASANNAATALARLSGLGVKGFVSAMNAKAKVLGLKDTRFVDPSGIDPKNMTTARDMAKIATAAFNTNEIRVAATTAQYRFTIRNTGQAKTLKNTNGLLMENGPESVYVTGGKTGFLYESQHNLAVRLRPSAAMKDRTLMVIVFGASTDAASFASAKGLAKWAWNSYMWDSNADMIGVR